MNADATMSAGPAPGDAVSAAFGLHQSGKRREAEAAYRQILRDEPDNADALHLLGQLAHECGHHRDGEVLMRRAIELMPDAPDFHNNLGALLKRTGRAAAALPRFRRAIELRPGYAEAYNNMGAALEALGDGDAAADAYRRAVDLRPGYAGAYTNLSAALEWVGRPEAATEVRRRLVQARPHDAQAHSDLLTGMLYHAGNDAEAILEEHLRWAARQEAPLLGKCRPHDNDRAAGRVLRVGYVSPDFRAHPVVRFFAPVLAYHDRRAFSITCYSHVAVPDAITAQLRQRSDQWREIAAMDDDAAAELIRRDKIDILVDLCGHMPQNRLRLFARKPAPVQVAYLGYPTTTGMRTMDWRLTAERLDPFDSAQDRPFGSAQHRPSDSAEDRPFDSAQGRSLDAAHGAPAGEADRLHTERLARIEGGCWCYSADERGPDVNELPALSGQPVTFAMFNRLVKVMPDTVRLWARILSAVPGSRLLFLATERGDLQRSTLDGFRREGFPMDRLVTVGRRPRPHYMKLFHQADLSLDPFPYAGQTTTCDALWMGVPTVTLAGRTHVTRAGLAIMESVGLGEFVARTPEEYVAIATRWAGDLPRLGQLRAGLRQRMARSPLCDPARLTRGIEAAYREMWTGWCERAG